MSLASEGDVPRSPCIVFRLLQVVPQYPVLSIAAQEVALVEIKAINAEVKERYGSPRIHQELKKRGLKTSLNTIAKIMRKNSMRAKFSRKFRCSTDSNHSFL